MKKARFIALVTSIMSSVSLTAGAAYPVYNPAQFQNAMPQYNMQVQANPLTNTTPQQLMMASGQKKGPQSYTIAAVNPNRITGALPRVGSTATNAGRQYYQASDYNRLAESGLYIGLSAGYTTMVHGQMSADYAGAENAFFAPGSFRASDFQKDSILPLQISVGAAINSDIRVDFAFLRYSGLSYASNVQTFTGDGYADATVSGGAITSNSTMLNIYYNIDSYTGYMMGGALRPYIGGGIGLALNTIADYVVYDDTFYAEVSIDDVQSGNVPAGELTGISDVFAYHNGGTMEQIAFNLEAGVTTDMNEGLKLDLFIRYANLGTVKTSGSIIVSQTEWLSDGAGSEYEAPYDSVFHYTNWFESGRLSAFDVGARLRLVF